MKEVSQAELMLAGNPNRVNVFSLLILGKHSWVVSRLKF